jgi:RNA polymerase sigma-70 factor (ECF subfamily)
MDRSEADILLVRQIRAGDARAWKTCIERFEGRLIAFVFSRLRDRPASEDVVQETFVGFLNALANFDESRPLEAFLFAIAAHKLTDHLRRKGRRPVLSESADELDQNNEAGSRGRRASSMMQSQERRRTEEDVLVGVLSQLVEEWTARGQYERLKCIELLFVKGLANNAAAAELGISEQDVANYKHAVVTRLKAAAERSALPRFDLQSLGIA